MQLAGLQSNKTVIEFERNVAEVGKFVAPKGGKAPCIQMCQPREKHQGSPTQDTKMGQGRLAVQGKYFFILI